MVVKKTIYLDGHERVVDNMEDAAVIMEEEYDYDGNLIRSAIYRKEGKPIPKFKRPDTS